MAREYARVKIKIWADTDFRDLTDPAQSMYFRLITSPTLNLVGVADWRPQRLIPLTRGATLESSRAAARELQEHGYVVVDEETEEILVRSFIRHDGVVKSPNIASAMVKDFAATASSTLCGVIVHELHRLHDEEPDLKGWPVVRDLLDNPSIDPASIDAEPLSNGSEMVPDRFPEPSSNTSSNGSPIPQPSSLNLQPATSSPARKRATQLPTDWAPNDTHRRLASERSHDVNALAEVFKDHHIAKASTYVDWDAAFRTWIRKERPAAGGRPSGRPANPNSSEFWDREMAEARAKDAALETHPFKQIGQTA